MDISTPCRTTRRACLRLALLAPAATLLPRAAFAAHDVKLWPPRTPVPALALSDIDGKPWRLDALKGRPVLLNFWATWCAPCRAEMPTLQQLAARHAAAGLVVVTVNYKESAATVKRFTDALPMTLPVLLDSDGSAASAWTPRVFPSTVLIGRDGRPQRTVIGELDWLGADADALIAPLVTTAPRQRTA